MKPTEPQELVHVIRRWGVDELPFCKLVEPKRFLFKTEARDGLDEHGHPMNMCPECMQVVAYEAKIRGDR